MLKDRLKRFRRKRSSCDPTPEKPVIPKRPRSSLSALSCELPQILNGEDHESYVRHCKKLVELSTEKSPSINVVNTVMERSFAIRRQQVITNLPSVTDILLQHPFLRKSNEVCE